VCPGWVVGSLEILGSPASLVRSIGNGVSDFFRLPYEGLTRGPGAFVSGVSRGTTSFVKHISKEHRRRFGHRLAVVAAAASGGGHIGCSTPGSVCPTTLLLLLHRSMWGDSGHRGSAHAELPAVLDLPSSAAGTAKGVISGVGKGIVGVFHQSPSAEQLTGILHGAGLWQLPRQLYLPAEDNAALAPNSHLKYVWKLLQSLGRPEVHMALEVTIVSGSGQPHAGCLLLTSRRAVRGQPERGHAAAGLPHHRADRDQRHRAARDAGAGRRPRPPSATATWWSPPSPPCFASKFAAVKNRALRVGFH
ncbi:hypothetical protein CRUP_006242, partial [Coryphaenoides rupestris]